MTIISLTEFHGKDLIQTVNKLTTK